MYVSLIEKKEETLFEDVFQGRSVLERSPEDVLERIFHLCHSLCRESSLAYPSTAQNGDDAAEIALNPVLHHAQFLHASIKRVENGHVNHIFAPDAMLLALPATLSRNARERCRA